MNNQFPLFGNAEEQSSLTKQGSHQLPIIDNGYFDALVAIGAAALIDSFFGQEQPLFIKKTTDGYLINYPTTTKSTPNLGWLCYSLPKSWKNNEVIKNNPNQTLRLRRKTEKHENKANLTQNKNSNESNNNESKDSKEEKKILFDHEGCVVDTSIENIIKIQIGDKITEIKDPIIQLYGVANKLGDPAWMNLCVFIARNHGTNLVFNDLKEKISFNSLIYPQGSKGANSSNSFSVNNGSIPFAFVKDQNWSSLYMSKYIILATCGFIYASTGRLNGSNSKSTSNIVIPMPQTMTIGALGSIIKRNRERKILGGFFFPYDNYLNYIKLLLIYQSNKFDPLTETLAGVVGASYIDLGNSSSPSATWQLTVPKHKYSLSSLELLQKLLRSWWAASKAKGDSDPSVNRKAVRTLMQGFEDSDLPPVLEGYLSYISIHGLIRNSNSGVIKFKFLSQTFFEEIMEHQKSYGKLLQAFKSEEVQDFIQLVRQQTYSMVYYPPNRPKPSGNPNYQVMRKLKEVQSVGDLVNAISSISIDRSMSKIASAKGSDDGLKYLSLPSESSITTLTALAEEYEHEGGARLVAHLVLTFALSKRTNEQVSDDEQTEPDDNDKD